MKCSHCWSERLIQCKGGYIIFGLDENDDLSMLYSERAYECKIDLGDEVIEGDFVRVVRTICKSCGKVESNIHPEDTETLSEMDSILCRYNDIPERKEEYHEFEEDFYA